MKKAEYYESCFDFQKEIDACLSDIDTQVVSYEDDQKESFL